MPSSSPIVDSLRPRSVRVDISSNSFSHGDSVIVALCSVSETQPSSSNTTRFNDLPYEVINLLVLFMHSDKGIGNLALASKFFYYATDVKVIWNIRRLYFVERDRVIPLLKLLTPSTTESSECIIASGGRFYIPELDTLSIPKTLDGAQSIASIVHRTKPPDLILYYCDLTCEMLIAITNVMPNRNWSRLY